MMGALCVAEPIRAADTVVKDDWDWVPAMISIARQGKDRTKAGVVLSLGDSLTYANQSTRWAKNPDGASAEEKAVLTWSHAGRKNDSDGWWLAAVDRPGNRSETAASGVRTDEFLRGGKGGLPPLKAILEQYRPQVAFVLLGANDASAGRKPDEVEKEMRSIIEMLLNNGTIPVLQTVAPRAQDGKNELSRKYNELYVALAREKKIPLIDLYGEFVTRAPDGAWKTQLLGNDGIHFSGELAGGPPSEKHLANCGYLLRCWLAVQKLKEIKTSVIDQVK
jgi:lysophospholipase L1-like esterase